MRGEPATSKNIQPFFVVTLHLHFLWLHFWICFNEIVSEIVFVGAKSPSWLAVYIYK